MNSAVWNWVPIDTRPLPSGKYLVGHHGHQEVMYFFGPEKQWAPGCNLGWHRVGHRTNEPADNPAERFRATHCVLIEAPPGGPSRPLTLLRCNI